MAALQPLQPGRFDQRITVQQESRADDGYGGSVLTWTTYATRWATVRALKGQERQMAQQTEAGVDVEFQVRRDSIMAAVTAAMRISWNSKTFNIRAVLDDGPRSTLLRIQAETGAAT